MAVATASWSAGSPLPLWGMRLARAGTQPRFQRAFQHGEGEKVAFCGGRSFLWAVGILSACESGRGLPHSKTLSRTSVLPRESHSFCPHVKFALNRYEASKPVAGGIPPGYSGASPILCTCAGLPAEDLAQRGDEMANLLSGSGCRRAGGEVVA